MKGNLETASLCGWKTAVYIPEGGKEKIPLLYMLGGKNIKEELADLAILWEKTESEKAFPFLLAGLGAAEWNSAYSPWPAPPLTREGEEFAGRASETGRFLMEEYLPYVCGRFPASERRENRAVVGLSICFWKRGSLPGRPAAPVPCGIRAGASIWKKLLCRKSRGMYIFPWAGQREGSVPV